MQQQFSKEVDLYIEKLPASTQKILKKIRQIITKAAPSAVESISYGMPGYKLHGKPLVYFAGWKTHVGLYATPSGNTAFQKQIEKYKSSKGAIQFQMTEPIPYDLIKKIVLFRVKEVAAKKV